MSPAGGSARRRFTGLGIATLIGCLGLVSEVRSEPAHPVFPTPASAFDYLHQVARHPRCANCHGMLRADGQRIPTIGEADAAPHPMNVTARLNPVDPGRSLGIRCTSCHGIENSPETGGPPGTWDACAEWQMPTYPATTLSRDISKPDLCRRWNDAVAENFRRALKSECREEKPRSVAEYFIHHIGNDGLIGWAFNPGAGREPAPGSLERLKAAARVWAPMLEHKTWCDAIKERQP